VAAEQSIIGIVPLPPIGEKSRGRCLSNKDQGNTTSGSESSSSTAETHSTPLLNEERPPQLVSIKVEVSPFDEEESNSDSDEEAFGSALLSLFRLKLRFLLSMKRSPTLIRMKKLLDPKFYRKGSKVIVLFRPLLSCCLCCTRLYPKCLPHFGIQLLMVH